MNPKISIIVPVFNTDKYLAKCIDSVLSQSFHDYELILVNDGSTDTSSTILHDYSEKDDRIIVIDNANHGVSYTRNCGLRISKGDYVIFLDSDDYWLQDSVLDTLFQAMEKQNIDAIRGEYRTVSENGNTIRISSHYNDRESYSNNALSSGLFFNNILHGEFFTFLFLFNGEKARSIQFDEELSFGEDMDYISRFLMSANRLSYIPLTFYAYLERSTSASSNQNTNAFYNSFSMCSRFHFYASCTTDKNLIQSFNYYSVMMFCWTLFSAASHMEMKKEIMKSNIVESIRLNAKSWSRGLTISPRHKLLLFLPPRISIRLLSLYRATYNHLISKKV